MKRIISVDKGISTALAHDITEIRANEFKGVAFHRGQILSGPDIEHLRRLGKEHLYVLEPESDEMHENEAAAKIGEALCGEGIGCNGPPREGKINLKATREGLLKVAVGLLNRFNALGEVICATIHTNTMVERDQKVATTGVIPLVIGRKRVQLAIKIAQEGEGVLRVLPLKEAKVGLLITGTEIYEGRVQDQFEPVIRRKVEALNGTMMDVIILPDDKDRISKEAKRLVKRKADILIIAGGMSVDPDDVSRCAIEMAGAKNVLYGAPVLPGVMFFLAYLQGVPVLGIPACGIYASTTVFDLIYPRILAGERITRQDLAVMGHGGYCLKCETCRFPACPFGKSG